MPEGGGEGGKKFKKGGGEGKGRPFAKKGRIVTSVYLLAIGRGEGEKKRDFVWEGWAKERKEKGGE